MANSYYTHTAYPATNAAGSSSAMRAELDAVMAGFSLLPNPLGTGQQGFSGGTWAAPTINNGVFNSGTFTGGTLDNMALGSITPAAAVVTTLAASGAAALAGGGSLTGTFTALAGAILSAFAITGGTINGTTIGGTTPSTAAFTTLTVSGTATFNGPVVTAGGFASSTGSLELGSVSVVGTPFLDFHSSGQNLDYDARIIANGGGGSIGAGTISYLANTHAFNTRPLFAGSVPWDHNNLANPFQATGGTISGFTSFSTRPSFNGAAPWDTINLPSPFQTTGGTITGATTFNVRPTFQGATLWDTANFNPASYVAFGQTATYADSALGLRLGGVTGGGRSVFNWSGQGGQPTWLWGGNDGTNMYVYNPSNFSVSYANSAGNANTASSVGGVSNPAVAGSNCQWNSGLVNFGVVSAINGGISAPYVVAGLGGPGNGTANAINVYGVVMRNQ